MVSRSAGRGSVTEPRGRGWHAQRDAAPVALLARVVRGGRSQHKLEHEPSPSAKFVVSVVLREPRPHRWSFVVAVASDDEVAIGRLRLELRDVDRIVDFILARAMAETA